MKITSRERNGLTLLDHLLYHRGIVEENEREQFLKPDYEKGLNDPFLLSDMEKAVGRIEKAIDTEEKIFIFSDYDADGIPGAVVFSDYFKMIGYKNVEVYIPHRHDEGFGLNNKAIEMMANEKGKLIITIDCGITDVEEVEKANSMGIDVIITDHHLPLQNENGEQVLPKAYAIVNPKISPHYPDKMLCGSGVIFKLVQAMLIKNRRGVLQGKEKWLLDMVGLATLSDMVPLKGENRILAKYGLKVFQKSPRLGIRKLLTSLKISQKDITEEDIAFMVTPRINVASRMSTPMDAFKLLSTDNDTEAMELVEKLNHLNSERKGTVGAIVKEIQQKIARRGLEDKSVIVLGNPSWNPAVLGLVANSLMKEHRKPAFLWGRSGETIKGSCRSEGGSDVVAMMREVPTGIFLDYGGHKMSGGFSIAVEKIHLLDEALQKSFTALALKNDNVEQECFIDHVLSLEEIDFNLWNTVDQLAPFGIDNHKPLFLLKDVSPTTVKKFGKQGEHLEVVFTSNKGKKVSAISFFASDNESLLKIAVGVPFTLVATLEKSMFKGFPELRLRIVDTL